MSKAHWQARIDNYDRPHPRLRRIAKIVVDLVNPNENPTTVLDVGCGKATLRSLLPTCVEYFGIDFTVEKLESTDPQHFSSEDLDNPQRAFQDRVFDIVICSGIFEYISHPEQFLQFVTSKVSAGGHLIFSYTNRRHHIDIYRTLRKKRHEYPDPDVNFMMIKRLLAMLQLHGFTIIRYEVLPSSARQRRLAAHTFVFPFNLFTRQYLLLLARTTR